MLLQQVKKSPHEFINMLLLYIQRQPILLERKNDTRCRHVSNVLLLTAAVHLSDERLWDLRGV